MDLIGLTWQEAARRINLEFGRLGVLAEALSGDNIQDRYLGVYTETSLQQAFRREPPADGSFALVLSPVPDKTDRYTRTVWVWWKGKWEISFAKEEIIPSVAENLLL